MIFAARLVLVSLSCCPPLARYQDEGPAPTVIRGSLVDERGAPLGNATIRLRIRCATTRNPAGFAEIVTDAQGMYTCGLTLLEDPEASYGLDWHWDADGGARCSRTTFLETELGAAIDLGKLALLDLGAATYLSRLPDEALLAELEGFREVRDRLGTEVPEIEAALLEMGHRGGPGWVEFLTSECDRIEALQTASHPSYDRDRSLLNVYLAALRLAERAPPPLVVHLEPVADSPSTVYPSWPTFRVSLHNEDQRSIEVLEGGSYRSGRFGRCRVIARSVDGDPIPLRMPPGSSGGGFATRTILAPGEGIDLTTTSIDAYVELPGPGEYMLRVAYHDDAEIHYPGDSWVVGRILHESEPTWVRIDPRPISIRRSELEQMIDWVATIDVDQRVPLVRTPWSSDLTYTTPATTPEDRLYRAGYDAVPALLHALENLETGPPLSPKHVNRRIDWLLGMLWNVARIHPDRNRSFATIRRKSWVGRWETVEGATGEEVAGLFRGTGVEWPSSYERAIEYALSQRVWFEIEIVDE